MKYIIACILAILACLLVSFLITSILTRKNKITGLKRVMMTSILAMVMLVVTFLVYSAVYYRSDDVSEYLETDDKVTVSKTESGYYFDGSGTDKAIIFYPGAKVEFTAYAPLMRALAEEGVDCFLVKMPFNMAFLGINKADKIIQNFEHAQWYMMGHSLGGVAAASYASANEGISGVILLGAYPTSSLNCPLLSIYGSSDGCLDREKYAESRDIWPEDTVEKIIKGGNHSHFARYGAQKGDGIAMITASQQLQITVETITGWLNGER